MYKLFQKLLLARLIGQYCFARGRLSSSVVVCNAAGGRAGRPLNAWTVGVPATGRVGVRAADTARRASTVATRCRSSDRSINQSYLI